MAQNEELTAHVEEMIADVERAQGIAQEAAAATSIDDVLAGAEAVFEITWGLPSGVQVGHVGAPQHQGWWERWQTVPENYDEAYAARFDTDGPSITNPAELGVIGRGRYVREQFAVYSDAPTEPGFHYEEEEVVASLNNVIGWMRLGHGITKGEHQPRIDLTYVWDQPIEFWQSTASTGWMQVAYAQALNILQTDYNGNLDMARDHTSELAELLDKMLHGQDYNGNGQVEPIPMEGGLYVALESLQSLTP